MIVSPLLDCLWSTLLLTQCMLRQASDPHYPAQDEQLLIMYCILFLFLSCEIKLNVAYVWAIMTKEKLCYVIKTS